MSKVEIKKCDICGDEQRSDGPSKYWANYHSDVVCLNFKSCPNIQQDISMEHLCVSCSKELFLIITDGIEFIKANKAVTQ